MADYHSLLTKLVEGLTESSAAKRETVYDRAKRALGEQLRTVEPRLSEAEIAREGQSLDDAIRQIEAGYSSADGAGPVEGVDVPVERAPDLLAGRVRQAPAETVAIRRGGRRKRPVALLAVLVLVAIPIAVVAWLWREQPPPAPVQAAREPEAAIQPPADVKYVERVGGGAPTPGRPASPPPGGGTASAQAGGPVATSQQPGAPPAAAPTPAVSPPPVTAPAVTSGSPAGAGAGGEISVAQRALIFEENPADPQKPTITAGRAVWRLDAVNGGQGQPLETVVRGSIDYPASGLSLRIVLRRNLDAALPASHTMELTFVNTSVGGAPVRVVRDVALPMMRPEEAIRGVPVAGLPVPVKENVFLIGLSDLRADVERNLELLLRRNWMELPIRFASGQKAALLFDKGVSGERVFYDAFRQWGQVQ